MAFPGLIKNVEQRYKETGSDAMKQEYESFMRITPCKICKGQRLKKESLAVTVGDKNIYEVTALSIEKLCVFLKDLKLSSQQELIGKQILKEIRARVGFLKEVGLDYLSLSRATATLSGGRHRESVLPHRLVLVWSVLPISWMSRASDFIREIMINY